MRLALANAGDRKIDARLEVDPKTLSLNADPELLAQVVLNLLRNAIRATNDEAEPIVAVLFAREPNGQSRIEVRDNGPGIPLDRRDDIFLPFYTTHKGGSGVGLSFARQVALAHGGSICALDAPEGGANVRIVI
jgi:signal transduction histidine kinase